MSKINLYWCPDNFGDMLSPIIIAKLTGCKIRYVERSYRHNTIVLNVRIVLSLLTRMQFKKIKNFFLGHWTKKIMSIGSILYCSDKRTIVWGSGIMYRNDIIRGGNFIAVRGPLSQQRLRELGFEVPQIIGDPALLLRKLFNYKNIDKKYDYGIIPHYKDYPEVDIYFEKFNDLGNLLLINLYDDPFKIIAQICSCKRIVSSSLHGIIVPHTYSIPAVWCKLSDKLEGDDCKFEDYFLSVGIKSYIPHKINIQTLLRDIDLYFNVYQNISLPSSKKIDKLCDDLLSVAPFEINCNFVDYTN
jgi:hypothetical protein